MNASGLPFPSSATLQHIRHRVLLLQEYPLPHILQQTPLFIPARDCRQVLRALLLRASDTQLHDDHPRQGGRSGGEDDVGVEAARGTFDAVSDVFDEVGGGAGIERARRDM